VALIAAVAFLAAGLMGFPYIAYAQQGSKATLSIGSDTSMAGGTIVLPLSLENADGLAVQSIRVELSLPKDDVSLTMARSSLAVETAGGKVAVQKLPVEKKSKVEKMALSITAPKPLQPGKVASLELRLAEKLGNVKEIPLTLSGGSLTTADQQSVPTLTQDGTITVSETAPTLVNCFFFTH
jgi:hypothetical protein